MNLFNEIEYLASNADVAAAVQAGAFTSGFDHYLQFGINEGRARNGNGDVFSFNNFNEDTYLQSNEDVAAAVLAGAFTSGLDHFLRFGESEGRTTGFDTILPSNNSVTLLPTNFFTSNSTSDSSIFPTLVNTNSSFQSFSQNIESDINLILLEISNQNTQNQQVIDINSIDVRGFDEAFYLANNPDVAAAVSAGAFVNGQAHFILHGDAEGRAGFADSDFFL